MVPMSYSGAIAMNTGTLDIGGYFQLRTMLNSEAALTCCKKSYWVQFT